MPSGRRFLSVFFSLVSLGWAILVFLASLLFGLAARCDESCGDGPGWQDDPHAWQWNLLVVAGAVVLVCGVAVVVFVWGRFRVAAACAALIGLAVVYFGAAGLSTEWIDHLDRRTPGQWFAFLLGVGSPLAAIAFTPRREPR